MKHYIIAFITFLLVSHSASAQLFSKERVQNNQNFDKKFLSWGYYLGFNSYDFNFDYNADKPDILVTKTLGFNVGLIGDMRLNDYIDFRIEPGLCITTRTLNYDPSYFDGMDFNDSDLEREVKSTYIHLPFLVKFSTKRLNNFKPFVVGGVSTAINLSSNEKNPEDNFNGQFRTVKNMYFYEIGFGIDFYLYYFKFTPSIRGIFAFNNEIVQDSQANSPWTSNVESMKTRGVFINFTFQ
ncbi:type IX secretion/gliding motility protein PorT/SprT [Mangrovimonas aestuarii]|uniref:type IX secretion/gliding motility protein PorT/SprT n=1 Tax=Mangrovimonas aestuarii TaxID=3018443 RepID=UPI0023790739|nr:porin family protein [Mangrovimonas aestuarii]